MGSLIASLWAVVVSGAWTPLWPPGALIYTWQERGETRWELWRLDNPQPCAAEGVASNEAKAGEQMAHAVAAMRIDGPSIVVRQRPEVTHA